MDAPAGPGACAPGGHPARGVGLTRVAAFAVAGMAASGALAQDAPLETFSFYGLTGALDTPTADTHPEGEAALTYGNFGGIGRTTLSFQILPRVQGAFRYAGYRDLNFAGFQDYYDRSFDVAVQVLRERRLFPAVKIGLQDLAGTGISSGEYLVATKGFWDGRVRISAGLGWGRLGSYEPLGQPFGDRPDLDAGRGGTFNADQYFRGDTAPFGSVAVRATDRLTLMAEYSSDAYAFETGASDRNVDPLFERDSPVNFGLDYRLNDAISLGAGYFYGSELGLRLTIHANPYRPPQRGSVGPAPEPVTPRPPRSESPDLWVEGWTNATTAEDQLLASLSEALDGEGLTVTSFEIVDANRVRVRFRNTRYGAEAQAVGRMARALTRTMPSSVEFFEIIPAEVGLAFSRVTLRRSDLEALVAAPDASDRLWSVAGIAEAPRDGGTRNPDLFPRTDLSLRPYIRRVLFDPGTPVQFEVGARLAGLVEPRPGLIFSGSISKPVGGNIDDPVVSGSRLPAVRTSFPLYYDDDGIRLDRAQGAYYFRPAQSVYGRVTAGYLERAFGGISTELLWKPVGSRLGLGAELNAVRQRDFDDEFGFRDYNVLTGHASAYLDLTRGFTAQLDVGRYLAGDEGATFSIDREFRNGWRVGAFATVTNVTDEEFGEGSFDKGISFSIPLQWLSGRPSRTSFGTTIRPIQRDGGARLSVDGRLYGVVDDYHERGLSQQWGRVWR